MSNRSVFGNIASTGTERIAPDPVGTAEAFAQSGYHFPDAIADLVDNSVDAGASIVLVRFITDETSIRSIAVVDNGSGMTEAQLQAAMQYGGQFHRGKRDLGKYGVGMKSASLSQCRSLSVLSAERRSVSGRRWRKESIHQDWACEILQPRAIKRFFGLDWGVASPLPHGTIVRWDGLDRLNGEQGSVDARIDRLFKDLRNHLGLVFHRFLAGDRIQLWLDRVDAQSWAPGLASRIDSLDPFDYSGKSGRRGYPRQFRIRLDGGIPLRLRAHIWPPHSKLPGYRLGGGQVASRQGFYFYRNDRLIQAGGWNGWRESDNEPHFSLARVAVDLPPSADRAFGLSLHKSSVDVPPGFLDALSETQSGSVAFKEYPQIADDVYRKAAAEEEQRSFVPTMGKGLPGTVRSDYKRTVKVTRRNARPFEFKWKRSLPKSKLFVINRDDDVVELNSRYRKTILSGRRASTNDAPLEKALLFMLLRDQLRRERVTKGSQKAEDEINQVLLSIIEAMG